MKIHCKTTAGFSLIELMIVVAIIGIISAIAIPNYSAYVQRGKVQEATSNLADARTKLELYFMDNRTYAGGAAPWACGSKAPPTGTTQNFTYRCVGTATTYVISADGVAANGMGGFNYTVNESNTQTSTFTGVAGWNNSATCWVTKKGLTC